MSRVEGDRREDAIAWRIRLSGDAGADDWLAFSAWLEADPLNSDAYDRVVDAEAWGEPRLAQVRPSASPVAVNDDGPAQRRWIMPITVAAGLVAAVAVAGTVLERPSPQPLLLATAAGEHRVVSLSDGSRVALNGGTTLTIGGSDPRHVTLVRGEALFTVNHDAARPFEVASGDLVVRDLGTIFDVAQEGGQTRVAVAAGQVSVTSGATVLADGLTAGRQLVSRGDLVATSAIGPADVGGWERGHLVFADAPLMQVASEISRTTGVPIRVDSALASKRFTGLLIVDHDRDAMFRRLGPLLGVRAVRDGGGWQWVSPSAP